MQLHPGHILRVTPAKEANLSFPWKGTKDAVFIIQLLKEKFLHVKDRTAVRSFLYNLLDLEIL